MTAGTDAIALSARQAAAALGISPRLLARLTASGEIPSVTVGRRRLYGAASLSLWFETRERLQAQARNEADQPDYVQNESGATT